MKKIIVGLIALLCYTFIFSVITGVIKFEKRNFKPVVITPKRSTDTDYFNGYTVVKFDIPKVDTILKVDTIPIVLLVSGLRTNNLRVIRGFKIGGTYYNQCMGKLNTHNFIIWIEAVRSIEIY